MSFWDFTFRLLDIYVFQTHHGGKKFVGIYIATVLPVVPKKTIPEPTVNICMSYYPSLTKKIQCVSHSILGLCAKFHPSSTFSTHVMQGNVKICISL